MNKNKFYYILIIVLSTTLFIAAVGITSVLTAVNIIEESSYKEMTLFAKNTCQEFDSNISSIEQCVDTLALTASDMVTDFEKFKTNPDYVNEYTNNLKTLIKNSILNTQGAVSIYIRYNMDFAEPTSGLLFVLNEDTGDFLEYPVSDLSKYTDHYIPWYNEPVKNGKATWINPYKNDYITHELITYVVPYYCDNELVGVIGVDINLEYIEELINSIQLYDTGFAFLTDGKGNVVVHKDFELLEPIASKDKIKDIKVSNNNNEFQGEFRGKQVTVVYSQTKNNMTLGVQAPNNEIYKASRSLIARILIIELIALLAISILTTVIVRKLFKMSEIDGLTGLYNRKYFVRTYKEMKPEDLYNYSLFIFDIDKFKNINDTYGHNTGDKAIINTAIIAKERIGKYGILARWGGDEFIGLINPNLAESVLNEIRETIENQTNPEYGKVTISIGYTHIKDNTSFSDIYDRADQALYESKENGRNRVTKK